jgi:hypothetical protein
MGFDENFDQNNGWGPKLIPSSQNQNAKTLDEIV